MEAPRRSLSLAPLLVLAALAALAAGCSWPDYDRDGDRSTASSTSPTDPGPDAGTTSAETTAHSLSAEFPSSATCATCHPTITAQWATSMHARATSSLVTVAQTNQVVAAGTLGVGSPEQARLCVNCHAPVRATATNDGTLPFAANAVPDEGVSCGACHQMGKTPAYGSGGTATEYGGALTRGAAFYGPFSNPKSSSAHTSERREAFGDEGKLCGACHDVNVDRNGDGRARKVDDLVLQTTQDEYEAYRQTATAPKTCAGCHMPVMANVTRAADGVEGAPAREVHDHSFVGVDYPLDGSEDAQFAARTALLGGAATIAITSSAAGAVEVSVTNTGTGHALPTGFAFARQMWVELVVRDADGASVFSSGTLAKASNDLCDGDVLASSLLEHTRGCTAADAQLVNFQLKLVDAITATTDAAGAEVLDASGERVPRMADTGKEVVLQHATGGAVTRVRASDGARMGAIDPGQTRRFGYSFAAPATARRPLRATARLRFRNLPPYFLRALLAKEANASAVVERLVTIDMASATSELAQ